MNVRMLCKFLLACLPAAMWAQVQPAITPATGMFLDAVTVTITSPDPDAEIRFSTERNGKPSRESPLYTGPFTLTKTSAVHVQLFKGGQPLGGTVTTTLRVTRANIVHKKHPWKEQPKKAALLLTFAHADDDGAAFGGLIPYYAQVRKLPLIGICVVCSDEPDSGRWRRKELENAFWTYGMRNAPLFANAPDTDWPKHQAISHYYETWEFKKLVAYLTLQIRTFQPEVIVTHDFYGEYLHTHHVMTALATHDAYFLANDPTAFPEQLARVRVWQPKKLYAQVGTRDQIEFDWSIAYPELGGKTPLQVTREGMQSYQSQFVSQSSQNRQPNQIRHGVKYGLLKTHVGPDVLKNDFFENIDVSGLK